MRKRFVPNSSGLGSANPNVMVTHVAGGHHRRVRVREETVSMRWTLLMFIQEFARHAGHGDILREQIDQTLPGEDRA